MKWKDNFLRTFKRELTMMGVLVKNSDTQLNNVVADLQRFHERSEMGIVELSSQINALRNEVELHLMDLKDQELQKKVLKKQWNDSVGCITDDRCVAKVQVVLEQILKTKAQFSEDRKRPSLTFNEEQIHKYEKNRLSENCTKIKSLFFDHCLSGAKDQFTRYHSWFRMGWDVRRRCEILEKKLLNLADRSEGFVDKLNALCLQYNDEVELKVQKVQETMRDREFISLTPSMAKQGAAGSMTESMSSSASREENKRKRPHLIKDLLTSLEESQRYVGDMKHGLDENTFLLQSFSKELSSMPADPNQDLNYKGPETRHSGMPADPNQDLNFKGPETKHSCMPADSNQDLNYKGPVTRLSYMPANPNQDLNYKGPVTNQHF
ncbi:uncharacterized protein LOC128554087 [Mercenaria mercenaria]|uniref:uncharacterized protein LOC128554087 n=1 Tax=Mercenaria mercenaria TaxID=6596 RepID=UPI00234E8228|nr:uncharacterized protein LOC128554087 [Mercenaria mercenaria]